MTLSIAQHPQTALPQPPPMWDAEYRALRVGQYVVKEYRVPCRNQEAILEAFQEEGWPHRIFDPLPQQGDVEPKCRLRETIKSLNRLQKHPIIRFRGDGTGEGVCWDHVEATVLAIPFLAKPKQKLRRAA